MRAYPCPKCEFIYMGDDAPDGACPACGSDWSPSLEASLVASAPQPAADPRPEPQVPRRSGRPFMGGLLLGLGLALPLAGLWGRSLFAPHDRPVSAPALVDRAGLLPQLTGSTGEVESLRKELQQTGAALEARTAELQQARTDARSAEQRYIDVLTDLQEAQDELDRMAVEAELVHTTREQTFVHTWQVLGPFPNADPPPEGMPVGGRVHLAQKYAGLSGEVEWKAFESDNDKLDFGAACGSRDRALVLAACWVHSQADQPIKLSIGSDDGVRVWVNQQSVHENKTQRGASPGQDAVRAEFKAGWNEILVQVDNIGAGDWALFFEFRNPDNDQPVKMPCTNQPPRERDRR